VQVVALAVVAFVVVALACFAEGFFGFFLPCFAAGFRTPGVASVLARGVLNTGVDVPVPGEPKSGCAPWYSSLLDSSLLVQLMYPPPSTML
jgi:hypothetical protein